MAEEDHQDQVKQTLPLADEALAAAAVDEENRNQQVNKFFHLKLKIPTKTADYHHHRRRPCQFVVKEEEAEEEEVLPQQKLLGGLRTCSECGKQFTSGKALGGHKRACLQKIKNQNNTGNCSKNLKKEIKSAVANGDEGNSNSNFCYVCHQSFRSVKSLYGHMRKHPEREWRGVQPPKNNPPPPPHLSAAVGSSSSFSPTRIISRDDGGGGEGSMGSGSGGDLVDSLKGWSAKRKRGQRLLTSSSSSSSDEEDKDEQEAMQQAVNDLLLLSQLSADDCAAATSKMNNNNSKMVIDDDNGDQKKKKKNVDEMKEDGLGFDDCKSEDIKEDYDGDDDDSEEMKMMVIMKKNQQKKTKKRKLNELDYATIKEEPMMMMVAPTSTNTQTYSCPICNKAFDKHQALGGHVASHNKNKNVTESPSAATVAAAEDNVAEQVVAAAAVSDKETGESSSAGGSSSDHKCNLCNKTFPTGQALGGHKRCHWTGHVEAFSSSSQFTTSTGEVTQGAPRVVHDFDLNDTPPEYYQFHDLESAPTATVS